MEKIHESDFPAKANIVGGRLIHMLKNFLTPDEMAKVRYVAQGFADALKQVLAHDVTTLRPALIRLILCIAAVLTLRSFSPDVTQAYLQTKDVLTRLVSLRPKPEDRALFVLADGELLKLLKPLWLYCSGD